MWRLGAVLLLVGCGGAPTALRDAAAPPGDGDVRCRTADQFSQSRKPFDLCAVDSDCHDPFLECAAKSVSTCRDQAASPVAAAAAADAGCPSPFPSDTPVCPAMAEISLRVCALRYQEPCTSDMDCGPAGFACAGGSCQQTGAGLCGSDADCPNGWSCYAPCACNGADTTPKGCYPPFAMFGCPVCVNGTGTENDAASSD
jgi:hypothetical protein